MLRTKGACPLSAAAASLTDPDQAAEFVAQTGVDLLAVSAGNVHILLNGQCDLNLPHLAAIQDKVKVPLVLHGGSGISNWSLSGAIEIGVAKVNYGTYLKQRCLDRIGREWHPYVGGVMRRRLAESLNLPPHVESQFLPPDNPHQLLGDGSETDLTVIVRRAVRDAVLERIELLGSCGRA